MITNGIHSNKETPPNVPMITITPTRAAKRSIESTVESTVMAVMKAMTSQSPHVQPNLSMSSPCSSFQASSGLGVSPGKTVDIRGKNFTHYPVTRS